jgi:hypothetical protein
LTFLSLFFSFLFLSTAITVLPERVVSRSFPYETRAARANNIVENQQTSSDITKLGFVSKSSKSWNSLPAHLKLETKLLKFKTMLKTWIKENVPP